MIGWIFGARRLRERGILGMNRRNADYILARNSPTAIALVDDKLRVHRLCASIGVPTPSVLAVVERTADLRPCVDHLDILQEFVIKPARGSGGRGVLVIVGRDSSSFRRSNSRPMTSAAISNHLSDVISGMHSLGGRPDAALVQERVRLHPDLATLAVDGIPDIRIVLYRGEPAMAMLRLPTRSSGGRANLHQGGLGVGIEMQSGRTYHAVQGTVTIHRHPDSGAQLNGLCVPDWNAILNMSRQVAAAVGLGYLGVDIVLDPRRGPLLLEANARPGLAIQHANAAGLVPRLQEIETRLRERNLRDSQELERAVANLPVASGIPTMDPDVAAA
jgi:alpha-L-glutamate ligase-like protein